MTDVLENYAWVKYPFKVQDRSMYLSIFAQKTTYLFFLSRGFLKISLIQWFLIFLLILFVEPIISMSLIAEQILVWQC